MNTDRRKGRRVFAAGRLPRKAKKVCSGGNHYGRPLRADQYNAAGWIWTGMADCSTCGSTVSVSQFRSAA